VGGPSTVQNIAAQIRDAYSADIVEGLFAGASTFPVVDAAKAGNDGFACAAHPAFALYNAIALIQQGNCSFNIKATNAAKAGALGIIFYMNTAQPIIVTVSRPVDTGGRDATWGRTFRFMGRTWRVRTQWGTTPSWGAMRRRFCRTP
jgi:hypothetical protein